MIILLILLHTFKGIQYLYPYYFLLSTKVDELFATLFYT